MLQNQYEKTTQKTKKPLGRADADHYNGGWRVIFGGGGAISPRERRKMHLIAGFVLGLTVHHLFARVLIQEILREKGR